MSKSTIHLIPCPIAENTTHVLPKYLIDQVHRLDHFIVERAKTARAFLKAIEHPIPQSKLLVEQMDKHDNSVHLDMATSWIHQGISFGVISEAGCPGIADPGAKIVEIGHKMAANIVPYVGPSSILLALMASGANGQHFCFHGYLPSKAPQLRNQLKEMTRMIDQKSQSQLFIETPYRNVQLFKELIQAVPKHRKLCIALDITGKNEFIKTRTIDQWKSSGFPTVEKTPCLYILF